VKNCEHFRSLVSRFAEGEADPAEALGIARHVTACTACKIVLARERRLHEALEGLGDAVSVDDEFSRLVMAALPAGPPPAASRPRRRGLRLAGLVALVALGGAAAFRLLAFPAPSGPVTLVSRLDLEGGSRLLDGLGQLAGAAAAMIMQAAVAWPSRLLPTGAGIRLGLAGLVAAAAVLTAGMLVGIATWSIGRRSFGTGSPAESVRDRSARPRH
jgi:anti-sigma factor RsiW